jgi:hypothetical protein
MVIMKGGLERTGAEKKDFRSRNRIQTPPE